MKRVIETIEVLRTEEGRNVSASSIEGGASDGVLVSPGLSPPLLDLLDAAVGYGAVKPSYKVDEWLCDLEEAVASGGAAARAAYEAGKAELLGKNPVWAGINGAWSGASVQLEFAALLILVLLLLLAPVGLLLLILGRFVAALVAAIRAATG